MQSVNRRDFVKMVSAGAAVSLASCETIAYALDYSEGPAIPDTFAEEYEADIVVVGSGTAGFSAAVQAAQNGASVILLEKFEVFGGNSNLTGGVFGLNSPMQIEAGITDITVGHCVDEAMVYTNYRSSGALWSEYVRQSGANIQWLLDQGVVFDSVENYKGVGSFECFHRWSKPDGTHNCMVSAMSAAAEALGVTIMNSVTAQQLLLDSAGEVAGVYATGTEDGRDLAFHAKAVILCSGGFGGDLEMVGEAIGKDTSLATTDSTSMGEGFRMARSMGAGKAPTCTLPKNHVPGYSQFVPISIAACFQPFLFVNEEGIRYMMEDLRKKLDSALAINAMLSQRKSFTVFDSNSVDMMVNTGTIDGARAYPAGSLLPTLVEDIDASIAAGENVAWKADTIEELAVGMGVDVDNLVATVARYNELCDKGADEDFLKNPEYLFPVTEPPFYAISTALHIVTTVGGVDVNMKNQVVTEAGEPIPRLYSAGAECCKLYQETYSYQISGGMQGYCVYSGRNAANNACKAVF